VKEYCFKVPSSEELSHDYLWRFWSALPARGNISIFNRSYYEDVLVGKVHKLYENRIVPDRMKNIDVIQKRYNEINDFEKYLYDNGTRIVKIFLNVSKDEQAKRFISRIDTPKKNWKVSENDIKEREYWDDYQDAFEAMINKTSSTRSPWYVVPADHKWYARLIVSRIVLETLKEINPHFPNTTDETVDKMQEHRKRLVASLSGKKKKHHHKNKMNKNKNKEDKRNTIVVEKVVDTTHENAFFDASSVVAETYVEAELSKTDETKLDVQKCSENHEMLLESNDTVI
jgi:PPK2 family polyphosphate:nucleotide phosphotransferase